MSKNKFDLFKLHDKKVDISPKSWICFKGKNLRKSFMGLFNQIIEEKQLSKKELSRIIKNRLKCSLGPIEEIIYNDREWIPIPLFEMVISLCKAPKYFNLINENVEYIKCNSNKSKPIKAVKTINIDLAKICGAHAADGNICNRIGIEIKDSKIKEDLIKILKNNNYEFKIFKTKKALRIRLKNTH